MPLPKPRNRLVYFRVSEEEFSRLNDIRASSDARSISDLARSAMETIIQNGTSSKISEYFNLLQKQLSDLNEKVDQLLEDRPSLAQSLGTSTVNNLKGGDVK